MGFFLSINMCHAVFGIIDWTYIGWYIQLLVKLGLWCSDSNER